MKAISELRNGKRLRPRPGFDEPIPPPLTSGYEQIETDVGAVWISTQDEVMRPYMAKRGYWEPEEGRLLRSLLRPGMRFLDVGANVGYFSLLAADVSPDIEIEAVEPLPVNLAALRFNLWANAVRATVWPLALDATSRALELTVSPSNLGDTRSSAASDPKAPLVVPAIEGDELFAGRTFDVVKIDVQGWELPVIQGMRRTLKASGNVAMVVEFWPHVLRARNVDPIGVLEEYRRMGFSRRVSVVDRLEEPDDEELVRLCDTAGPTGQVNLLLRGQA
jgi:FkbM family methyltransferase